MIFSRKYAGKWIASKEGKVVGSEKKLETLVKKVVNLKNNSAIRFDKVPPKNFAGTSNGI